MTKILPLGILTGLTAAVLLHGVVLEASGQTGSDSRGFDPQKKGGSIGNKKGTGTMPNKKGTGPGTGPGNGTGGKKGKGNGDFLKDILPGLLSGLQPGQGGGAGGGDIGGGAGPMTGGPGPMTGGDPGAGFNPGYNPGFNPGVGPGLGGDPGVGPGAGPGFNPGAGPGAGPDPITGPGAGPGPSTGPGAGPGTGPAGDPTAGNNPEMKPFTKRFLKVKNDSGQKLQVFVQYVVRTEDGEPMWFPGEPGTEKAVQFIMEPGQELFVEANGKKLATGLVRIWAAGEKGQFTEYRAKDLWLVPEMDQNGVHYYMAPDLRTFTFVFPKQD